MFLIASIAYQCNLRCAGCYARAEGLCSDEAESAQMGAEEVGAGFPGKPCAWRLFILLAGGEPLLRRDVLKRRRAFRTSLPRIHENGTLSTRRIWISLTQTASDPRPQHGGEQRGDGQAPRGGRIGAHRPDGYGFGSAGSYLPPP